MTLSEKTYQAIIGVLVLIILGLGWQVYSGGKGFPWSGNIATSSDMASGNASQGVKDEGSVTGSSASSPSFPSTPVITGSGEAVSVANQASGTEVAVSSVTLSQPGWVAVRDSGGRTLGAAWFDAGTHADVAVPLLRGTESGQSYQVLMYADDGDHQFDLHTDVLITNADGSVAGTTFSAE